MPTLRPRVLIADDQPDVLEALRLLLKGEDFDVEQVSSPTTMIRAANAAEFDAALIAVLASLSIGCHCLSIGSASSNARRGS